MSPLLLMSVATLLVAIALVGLVVMSWTLGQAVAATNVPRPAVGPRTPADSGLAYRDVTFPATDGVVLSGWYVPSRGAPRMYQRL